MTTLGILRGEHLAGDRTTCKTLVQASEEARARAGFACHVGKEVRDAEAVTVWGCALEGPRRTARSDLAKPCKVVGFTLVTVLEGYCAGRVLLGAPLALAAVLFVYLAGDVRVGRSCRGRPPTSWACVSG